MLGGMSLGMLTQFASLRISSELFPNLIISIRIMLARTLEFFGVPQVFGFGMAFGGSGFTTSSYTKVIAKFFSNQCIGVKFLQFLGEVVPMRSCLDQLLVSHDPNYIDYNSKHTFSVEISPTCCEDLICLSPKVVMSLGHLGPIVIYLRLLTTLLCLIHIP